jgi:hypothetical protein
VVDNAAAAQARGVRREVRRDRERPLRVQHPGFRRASLSIKLRELLTKINDQLRPVHVAGDPGEAVRIDHDDAFVQAAESVPLDWVPSQQDEEPHH